MNKRNSFQIWKSIWIAVVASLFLISIVAIYEVFTYLSTISEEQQGSLKYTEFLSASGGLGALIAFFTFIFTALGVLAIFVVFRQLKSDSEAVERESYQVLISPEMKSAKKLLYAPEVQKILRVVKADIADNPKGQQKSQFCDIRKKIDDVAKEVDTPLISGGRASFDHIESLINQYEYLSKLINEKQIAPKFATDMSQKNFTNVYEEVKPIIELRRYLSPDKYSLYAKEFSKFCESKD